MIPSEGIPVRLIGKATMWAREGRAIGRRGKSYEIEFMRDGKRHTMFFREKDFEPISKPQPIGISSPRK